MDWTMGLLSALDSCGEEGRVAADYLRLHKTRLGFRRVRSNVGAFWTPLGNINLNTIHFSPETPFSDPRLLTLIVHEVCHLQQGWVVSLSVYGELEAWQLQYRFYRRLTGSLLHPALTELLSLPLIWDRAVLGHARELMQVYAGTGYRVDLLPLYPLHAELMFLMFHRQPTVA